MKITLPISVVSLASAAALLVAGCRPASQPAAQTAGHGHDHPSGPPHGGTPVLVGEHDFHLELVNDTLSGKMLAYVLDDHMEHAESVPPVSFELIAKIGGQEHRATFVAGDGSAPAATNVTVFSSEAAWFKTATSFEGRIPKITLGGETFENVEFTYPKGTSHSH